MNIDPVGMEFVEWSDYLGDMLSSFGPVPSVTDETEWQSWALAVVGLPGVASQNPPNPYTYDNWLDWAKAFNQVVIVNG